MLQRSSVASILFQKEDSTAKLTPVPKGVELGMITKNYFFYLWVLRKLPPHLRGPSHFYFLLNSLAAAVFLIPISALMVWLSNPVASQSCLMAAMVIIFSAMSAAGVSMCVLWGR